MKQFENSTGLNNKGMRFCELARTLNFISAQDANKYLELQRISRKLASKEGEWKKIGDYLCEANCMTSYQVKMVLELMSDNA